MKTPVVRAIGISRSPLLIIDDFTGAIDEIGRIAADLGAFPPARGNSYPGLRRHIAPGDEAAASYARRTLGAVVPIVNAAFGINGFDLLDASFSMVTAPPAALVPVQRSPHFDSVDPNHLAVMHYISGTTGSGTAFYRQRSTGIERVSSANAERFVDTVKREGTAAAGYIAASNDWFEQIGSVEAAPDRLIVYPGSLLHSGIIPPGMTFSDDPRTGRLTANFFVTGRSR